MELASTRTVALGSFAFLVFWLTATFPKFRGLPIGRTAGALVSAALIVVFQVDSPDEAYASVNLPILGLLFGTMVVSVYLQRADMFKYLASVLSYQCRGGKDLLCRLSFLVAFTSALFTNDTCCVLFTEFILGFCKERGLPPEPFLLALASSSNLGSSATPIGNPQNLVIAIQSKISFGKFLIGLLPPMVLGVSLNLALLLAMYWKQLSHVSVSKSEPNIVDISDSSRLDDANRISNRDLEEGKGEIELKTQNSKGGGQFSLRRRNSIENPVTETLNTDKQSLGTTSTSNVTMMEHAYDSTGLDDMKQVLVGDRNCMSCPHVVCVVTESSEPEQETKSIGSPVSVLSLESSVSKRSTGAESNAKLWKHRLWKLSVYMVTLGMLAALLAGLDLSWSTITAAVALIVLDFEDAAPSLGKVSYSLLVFFSGMFITVDGFNRTGLPGKFWNAVEPHARINHASGTAVLTAVIILLSNIASNVPTVLLLGPRISASSAAIKGVSTTRAWFILAWASTVGGNLTLVGSAANLIVCEQARLATKMPYNLSFWRHLKFGFPSTLLTVAAGLPLIRG